MCKRNSPPIPAFDPPPTKQRATDSPCEAEAAGADKSAAREVQLERQLLQAGGKGGSAAVYGNVPVVDLSLPDDEVRAAMIAAASEVGFFSVTNHGIPEAAIDEAFGASATFFGQERAAKAEQAPFAAHLNCGYEYMSQVRPSTGTPDQKESLQVTARRGSMDGRWPSTDGFEPAARTLISAAHSLGNRLLSLLEPVACPHLPAGTLAGAHTLWAEDGQCTLRLLHYPPVDVSSVPEDYWRAGPHTDWCNLTLLFQRPGNAGLECAANPRAGGAGWLKVDPVEGGIAVNIGDMLSRWSNDSLLSNLHRVRMPTPEEARPPRPRYSMAFFMQADKHVLIESRHGAITAGDYILGRIRSNFDKKG